MEDALAETRGDLKRRAGFAFATAISMTFLAPWGSEHLPLPRRALEWLVCIAIWEAAVWLARDVVARWRGAGRTSGRASFRVYLLTLGVASVPAVPLCMLVINRTAGTFGDFVLFYADAMGLGLILAAIRYGMWGQRPAIRDVVAADLTAPLPVAGMSCRDFLGRHAPDLAGATLLALAAEDHYLRIAGAAASARCDRQSGRECGVTGAPFVLGGDACGASGRAQGAVLATGTALGAQYSRQQGACCCVPGGRLVVAVQAVARSSGPKASGSNSANVRTSSTLPDGLTMRILKSGAPNSRIFWRQPPQGAQARSPPPQMTRSAMRRPPAATMAEIAPPSAQMPSG